MATYARVYRSNHGIKWQEYRDNFSRQSINGWINVIVLTKKKKQRRELQIISGVRAFSLPNGVGGFTWENPDEPFESKRVVGEPTSFSLPSCTMKRTVSQKPPVIRLRKGGLLFGQALRLLPRYALHDGTVRWHGRVSLCIDVQTVMYKTRLPVATHRLATIWQQREFRLRYTNRMIPNL